MQSAELKILQRKGNNAVKKLRKAKFDKGLPFMIISNDLPSTQCYLEYADGRILLVGILSTSARDFSVIRELTPTERDIIRTKFHFP
ncbi:hypothetical protein [Chitinophaga sp. GbtcB8]|uniref:hypothetical protein n=1 Tax=Chitinophaga sp. GbtcB8 TaxID=2824753 RepID=UPI001C2FC5C4|nr:hypothetical protein [Chitinophaga sp. GbtcB8]